MWVSRHKEWRRVLCYLWGSTGLSESFSWEVMKTLIFCGIKNGLNKSSQGKIPDLAKSGIAAELCFHQLCELHHWIFFHSD